MIYVKTSFEGDYRRFSCSTKSDFSEFVDSLQQFYNFTTFSPPTTHALKYVDKNGDFLEITNSKDLIAAGDFSRILNPPILRLTIEKKAQPLLKICGKEVFAAKETVERYGPKKDHTQPKVDTTTLLDTGKRHFSPTQSPTELQTTQDLVDLIHLHNQNATTEHNVIIPSTTALTTTNTTTTNTMKSVLISSSSTSSSPYSCQNLSAEEKRKGLEGSQQISSSQRKLSHKTAKEITQFANEINDSYKALIAKNTQTSEDERQKVLQELEQMTNELKNQFSVSNDPQQMKSIVDNISKMRELATQRIGPEMTTLKEEGQEIMDAFLKSAKQLHEETVNKVKQEVQQII
jgi:hypothetical protein